LSSERNPKESPITRSTDGHQRSRWYLRYIQGLLFAPASEEAFENIRSVVHLTMPQGALNNSGIRRRLCHSLTSLASLMPWLFEFRAIPEGITHHSQHRWTSKVPVVSAAHSKLSKSSNLRGSSWNHRAHRAPGDAAGDIEVFGHPKMTLLFAGLSSAFDARDQFKPW